MSKLFIIGNGFDMAHGFKTSYENFKEWIEEQLPNPTPRYILPADVVMGNHGEDVIANYNDGLSFLKEMFDITPELETNWCNFEDSLAYIDLDSEFRECVDFTLGSDYQFNSESDEIIDNYVKTIKFNITSIPNYFYDWVREVDISEPTGFVKVRGEFKPDDLFLNFNYTETLELLYNVEKCNICHIHGDRTDFTSTFVVGHGGSLKKIEFDDNSDEDEADDPYEPDEPEFVNAKIDLEQAIEMLRKDYKSIIGRHKDFLKRIDGTVKDIYSYGWSFGESDKPYIDFIIHRLGDSKDVTWHLSDYDKEEKRRIIEKKLRDAGFEGKMTTFDSSTNSKTRKLVEI